jgi:restriction endonuclease Mrr
MFMTFYEAAIEVLRKSGRPLHFKKITEVAVRDQLLSHIGRDPAATMSLRLDDEVKSGGKAWIVQTRPGVFSLRTEVIDKLNEEHAEREPNPPPQPAPETDGPQSDSPPEVEETTVDEVEDENPEAVSGEAKRSRGRRRRGRQRSTPKANPDDGAGEQPGSDKGSEGADLTTDEDAQTDSAEAAEKPSEQSATTEPTSQVRRTRRQRNSTTSNSKVVAKQDTSTDKPVFENQQRFESVAEAAYSVLGKLGSPHTALQIATLVFDHKLVRFHTHDPEATVRASMVLENQIRSIAGTRPVFERVDDAWGLVEWHCSNRNLDRERQIKRLIDEMERETRTDLCKRLHALGGHNIEPIVLSILERVDYTNIKVSKRSADDGVYFSADWATGVSHRRVCIQLIGDAERTLTEADVTGLRDILGDYSAEEGMIVHVGPIAREVYRSQKQAGEQHIELMDVDRLVDLLFRFQLGLQTSKVPMVFVDHAFFSAI